MQEITSDAGIAGFIKAHRHPSGSVLVMANTKEDKHDVIAVYWIKRLSRKSKPVHPHAFVMINERSRWAAERMYELLLKSGPPEAALRDTQRERVYAWEDDHIFPGHRKLSWAGCERFTEEVWGEVGKGALHLTKDRRFLSAISLRGTIHLPQRDHKGEDRAYWRKPVILHEIAHELTPNNQHGPRFVTTYIELCEWFLGYDRLHLERLATEYEIHFY